MSKIATLCSAAAVALLAPIAAQAETTYIHAGSVISDADGEPSGQATITVTDGRIVEVLPGFAQPPADATLVDLKDHTVLPGLIDTHTHLSGDPGGDYWREAVDPTEWNTLVAAKNARLTARAGFTTVRDLGSGGQVMQSLRRATAEGLVPGPRIVTAGNSIAIIGGHADVSGFTPQINEALATGFTCTGATECAAVVRKASKQGAEVIKITATGGVLSQQARGLEAHFTDAEMESIVTTANSLGLKVAAHAHGARGIEAASRAGVDSIEHCTFGDDAAIAEMKRNKTACVPTLMAYTGIRERLGQGVYTPQVEDKIRATLEVVGQAAARMHEGGVELVFGTDAGVFEHGRNAEEFRMLRELVGMSNREALASATTRAARLLDMESEIGRIAPGYSADLIAVRGNPLSDVTVLENVDWTMVRGRTIE
ncbi:amidohydrolase family protein [Altererythrobacter aurantiacus]|uniref:Amidohydrolase family protein n=1 Tax=Parapontixanthobacter aurantiacus TaxID=1463599 RepID=A0A844ZN04_9SPHN|nr:amidohydrolase family protein [Parapontixanthobacter aurantiacus]MXO87029.1 amidohydrolase family protein [Parapontixanthobacter aurantiacus]